VTLKINNEKTNLVLWVISLRKIDFNVGVIYWGKEGGGN